MASEVRRDRSNEWKDDHFYAIEVVFLCHDFSTGVGMGLQLFPLRTYTRWVYFSPRSPIVVLHFVLGKAGNLTL